MKCFPVIIAKMPTVVGILTFRNRKTGILGLSKPETHELLDMFICLLSFKTSCSAVRVDLLVDGFCPPEKHT